MKARILQWGLALTISAMALPTHAQPVMGSAASIQIDGRSTVAQRILVIPVVDPNYVPINAGRDIETEFPGVRADIVSRYATMGTYWNEASYGMLNLQADVANCYYQVDQEFPVSGEIPFEPAQLRSAYVTWAWGTAFERVVLEYVADPTEPLQTVEFVADPAVPFYSSDDLVDHLTSQLSGAAADDLVITSEGVSSSGRLLFQIQPGRTFPGSMVRVNFTDSDPDSRVALGLTAPSISTNTTTGRTTITSEGAHFPGRFPNSTGPNLTFSLSDGTQTEPYAWTLTTLTPCTPTGVNACDSWQTVSELASYFSPPTGFFGEIREVSVDGRPEVQWEMAVPTGVDFNQFSVFNLGSASNPDQDEFLLYVLGLASFETQDGTTEGREDIDRNSGVLTGEALEALLNAELTDGVNAGCTAIELPNVTLPAPPAPGQDMTAYNAAVEQVKQAVDGVLTQYSAVHVFLLSMGNIIRENAWRTTLASELTDGGGGSMPYQLATSVAAVELGTSEGTIIHEVGHNIGFPDLYDYSNDETELPSEFHDKLTFPGDWDIMAGSSSLSYPSSFIKQSEHGWVSSAGFPHGNVVQFIAGSPSETFVVTPLGRSATDYEQALITAGVIADDGSGALRWVSTNERVAKMLVLPFGDDPNQGSSDYLPLHYLGIENRQVNPSGSDFNVQLPGTGFPLVRGGVIATDNLTDLLVNTTFLKPISRNYSHVLTPPNSLGEYPNAPGMAIAMNLDGTTTFPSFPGVSITNIGALDGPTPDDPPSVRVNVTYNITDTVDLHIQPWNAPAEYASEAIWFEPATTPTAPDPPAAPTEVGNVNPPRFASGYDPAANGGVPLNWIHIRVENFGTFNVENVQLKVQYNSPGGVGDPVQWQTLVGPVATEGSIMLPGKAIPAGGSTVFSVPWSPTTDIAANGHTCISAEVVSWEVAEGLGQVADINPYNNLSQENVHEMEMFGMSPWQDVPFEFEVHNSYDRTIEARFEPEGLLPGYEVTFEPRGTTLAGGASKIVKGTLHWDSDVIPEPPSQDPNDPFWQACNVTGETPVEVPMATTVYEAESMFHSTGGSYPEGWNIWSDGYISQNHDFAAGSNLIRVSALGQPAQGVFPHMLVSVGGSLVGEVDVTGSTFQNYDFNVVAQGGVEEISVAFDNDLYAPPEDRNLIVDSVTISSGGEPLAPAYCLNTWGVTAYAAEGDYRIPLGGVSFRTRAKPRADLTVTPIVDSDGDITVECGIDPPFGGQLVRIIVKYPSGEFDFIDVLTQSDGDCSIAFEPTERGPVTISTELPVGGGPFASTPPIETEVDACVPAGILP